MSSEIYPRLQLPLSGFFAVTLYICLITTSGSSKDFTKAFDHFRTLGFPDIADTTYIRISPKGSGGFFGGGDPYSALPGFYDLALKGNAWLVSQDPEAKTFTAIIQNGTEKTFSTAEISDGSLQVVEFKEADWQADWKTLEKYFAPGTQLDRASRDPNSAASVILAAANFHRQGLKKESTALVKSILSASENSEQVVTSAISKIADAQYLKAMKQAFEDGDFKSFADKCREIAKSFGQGWQFAPAALLMAEQLSIQATSPPALVAPDGIALTNEHQRIAKQLSEIDLSKALPYISNRGPWLFAEKETFQMIEQAVPEGGELLSDILKKKTEMIPVLIAMLDDRHFLPFPKPQGSRVVDEFQELLKSQPGARFGQNFVRPATRADIAEALIPPLITGLDSYNTSSEDLRGAAMNWWETVAGKSTLDLARIYFREGNKQQIPAALSYLAKNGDESDFPAIEESLIETATESPWNGFEGITSYLQARGEEGAPFLTRLEKEIETFLTSIKGDEDTDYDQYKESFDSNLKTVRSLMSNETAADLLAKVVSGEEKFEDRQQAIFAKMEGVPFPEQVQMMLQAAMDSKDKDLKMTILQYLSYLQNLNNSTIEIGPLAEIWKSLLKNTDETKNGGSVASYSAWMIENIHNPDGAVELQVFSQRAGDAAKAPLAARALARVEGKTGDDLPKLPSSKDVPEARKAELEKELLALAQNPEEFSEALESLKLAEKFVVVGEPFNPRSGEELKPTALQKAVVATQYRIEEITAPESWKDLQEWKGSTFSSKQLNKLSALALKRAVAGETFQIDVKRDSGFGPVSIEVKEVSYEELNKEGAITSVAIRSILTRVGEDRPFVGISMGSGYYNMFEFPEPKEDDPSPVDSRFVERQKESQEQNKAYLEVWFQAPTGLARGLRTTMIGTTTKPKKEDADTKE